MSTFQLAINSNLNDLNPVVAGCCSVGPGHTQHLGKNTSYFLIHYVCKGGGIYYIHDQSYPIKEGDCYMTPLGATATFVGDPISPLELEWVGFAGQLSHDFALLPPVFSVPEHPFPHNKLTQVPLPMLAVGLAGDLFHLYYNLLGSSKKNLNYVEYICDYVRAHYMEKISVEAFARQFGIDRRHMSAQFKKKTGYSVQEFITRVRIDKSMSYLAQGYSRKQVAVLCGFGDDHNFYKVFKRYQKMNPTDWKKHQITLSKENAPSKSEE